MSEKLEVLDLIINTLREHERELSEIATRLDEITQLLRDTIFEFIGGEVEGAISTPETPQPMSEYPNEEKMTETRTEEAEEREEIIPPETSQPRTTPLGKESMTETRHDEVGGQEENGSPKTPQSMPGEPTEDEVTDSVTKEAEGWGEESIDDDRFIKACKRVAWENFLKLLKEWGMLDILQSSSSTGKPKRCLKG